EPKLRDRQERAVALRLRRKLARWTPEHVRQTREFAQLLQDKAVTPDSAEALQTLPRLTRQDLPSKVKPLPLVRGSFANGLRWQRGEVFHNGISRARFLGDASGIPVEQTLHAGRLMALLPLLGNATQSYEAAAAERARLGVSYTLAFTESSRPDSPAPYRLMEISFSGLDRNYAAGLEILRRQLDTVVFTERKRLVEILRQGAAKATAALATRKNLVNCKSRAGVGIAPSGSLVEAINGFTGYLELQRLGKLTEGELDDFCEALRQCAATIRTLPLFACGFVGADECLAATEKFTDSFSIVARPQLFVPPKGIGPQLEPAVGRHEFCAINTQVSTCARVFAAPHRTEEGSMALKVLTGFLSVGYLWDEIRAKGGAYGTGFAYNDLDCIACLSSTEDPKARNTYRVFDALPDYLRKHTFTEREVGQAVLSAAGGFLRPDRPAELCIMAANHLWHDRTEEERQREFEALLAITPREVKEVANRFFDPQSARYNDCAAGPASAAIAGFTPISLKG
ncbi:MAG: hypothetical protein J6Y80_06995, partial [Victivallales bacterium]|nr:hypothetical protein [Victivallales bacterium]